MANRRALHFISMKKYVALLRGINVGGNSIIRMADLKTCLEEAGLHDVATYIQSGNVLFSSPLEQASLVSLIEIAIRDRFGFEVPVAVFSRERWREIIEAAPKEWGSNPAWKHNLLILLEPYDMGEIIKQIGVLKPGIETLVPGDGVLYQAMSLKLFGKTTTGKLAASPVYKRMTVRNYNTSRKLLELLDAMPEVQ